MDKFKLITASAGFIAVIISLCECLYPSERFGKQLKYIFSVILILTVTEPLLSGKIDPVQTVNRINVLSEQVSDKSNDVWGYFKNSVENNVSTDIMEYLEEKQIKADEIKTSINISESGSISINEIEITVKETVQEGEVIALIKEYINQDVFISIKEIAENEY